MTPPALAKTLDELTPEWLTAALGASHALDAGRVAEIGVEPVGTGQMGDVVRLRIAYENTTRPPPPTLIAKLASTDDQTRATGLATRSYEVEVNFYRQIQHSVAIQTPRCYFADVDTETGSFTVLLEDLAPAVQGDQISGCGVDEAALAMEQLARLHAPRWNDAALADHAWLNRLQGEPVAMLLTAMLPGFLERYADGLSPEHVDVVEASVAACSTYLCDRRQPLSLRHGDYRLDNMLFGKTAASAPLTVVDWQTVVHAEPLADASYFLGGSLSVADRREHEQSLMRVYHRALVSMGVDDYAWDQCWSDYRRHPYHGVVMVVVPSMLVERTPRGDQMFLETLRRFLTQIIDLETEELVLTAGNGGSAL